MVSMARAASWVVNALVDATPISGPARVSSTKFDSLTIELSATLQMLKVDKYFACLALRSAARVSAVSPDCEIVTKRVSGVITGLRYRYSLAISTRAGIRQICSMR